jgi:DNA-binding NtrC family response regulator
VREAYLNPGCELTLGQVKVRFQPYTEEVRLEVSERSSMGQMVGSSPEMRALYALIDKVAPSDISALIEGETGTGKELVAQALHERSHRAHKPFVVFDCSAVPEHLIESELFGHERGAFSGATRQHKGVFEQADGGTLFLDELGELALHLQPKLLRALESGAVKRVGGEGLVRVDVRVIAATNQPLFELMERGGFREDLYYRIAKLHIALAPLRSRGDDVLVISQRFLERLNQQNEGRRFVEGMDEEASALLRAWSWPGNVRELRNVIERAYTFAERQQISAQDLPVRLRDVWAAQTGEELERSEVSAGLKENEGTEGLYEIPDCYSLKEAKELIISRFERSYLVQLLSRHDSNISAVAREAGIDRRHVYRLMKKYHVE